jgi:4-amino-4-deoxy-L-arabinose transferase-like glycosyltransferase
VGAVVVLAAALVAYVFVTPIGEQSDELAHLHYAQLISHNLALPTDGVQERQQPPLYYMLVAGVLKVTGDDPRAARLVSVILTLITAILLVATLRALMPRRPWVALAGLLAFALLPGVQYEGAQISNDSLAWLAGALVALMLTLVTTRLRLSFSICAAVGVAVGIAIAAKATAWPLAVLLVIALVASHRRQLRAAQIAAVIAPVVVICGWWFARNVSAYGRLLPPMTPITGSGTHTLASVDQLPSWISLTWKSAVGIEGPHQTPIVVGPGRVGLYLLTGAALVAAGAVLLAMLRAFRMIRERRVTAGLWLLATPVLAVAFSLINSVTLDNQPQARYLLVAAAAWCGGVVWAIGIVVAGRPRLAASVGGMAVIGMLILDVATVQTLRLVT